MKGKHVSVGYRTVLLVILICVMIPLCSGCEEKSVVMPGRNWNIFFIRMQEMAR